MPLLNPATVVAACLTLLPFLTAAFFDQAIVRWVRIMPVWVRILSPAVLCLPYLFVARSAGIFRWGWLALYLLLPVALAGLLWQARTTDPERRGNWRDYLVLAGLGLAVDLRWFEPAWPARLGVFNKMLLLDAGIYGFMVLRQLDGVGFDLRPRWRDIGFGLRELAMYTPIAVILGLSLGFLHLHAVFPRPIQLAGFFFTFFFIAVPEELFFRGWMQNLLERRMGRYPALLVTAGLFGLSHFNKRAAHFNWRYVLLAAIAGVFYGRAWRHQRRVGASSITHAAVDTIWSIWLR
jgi:membrane protease YdiL (CAAX protease family)